MAKRRAWRPSGGPACYVDSFAEVAAALDRGERSVFVCGPVPSTDTLVTLASARPGSSIYSDGAVPALTFGRQRVTWAAGWWGPGITARQAAWAHGWLTTCLSDLWHAPIVLAPTPATTGRDLWLRSIPAGVEWPTMSEATGALVRSMSGQGRIETFAPPAGHEGPVTVYEYDRRLAYMSHLARLPIGEPERRGIRQVGAYETGFRFVRWRPPASWDRPGLLPIKVPGGERAWAWPASHEWHGPAWVSNVEIHAAVRFGWEIEEATDRGLHGLVWARTGDPFSVWADRLTRALRLAEGRIRTVEGRARMRYALRLLALSTIGAMHGSPRRVTRYGDDPPAGAAYVREMLGDGRLVWVEHEAATWRETVHPEWTGQVWARARARLLTDPQGCGLLHLPAGTAVAVRTDAIYTTAVWPWAGGERIGDYVRKRTFTAPRWPANGDDLVRMREAR